MASQAYKDSMVGSVARMEQALESNEPRISVDYQLQNAINQGKVS